MALGSQLLGLSLTFKDKKMFVWLNDYEYSKNLRVRT